jgi:ketosteroid isomerase-like protein
MTAASDKNLVRGFLEAWSSGLLDQAFAMTDPEGTVWMIASGQDIVLAEWTERIRNKAGHLRRGTRYVIGAMTSEGGRVSVIADGSSILANGAVYTNYYHFLFTVADGLIVRVLEFSDPRLSDAAFRSNQQRSLAPPASS